MKYKIGDEVYYEVVTWYGQNRNVYQSFTGVIVDIKNDHYVIESNQIWVPRHYVRECDVQGKVQ